MFDAELWASIEADLSRNGFSYPATIGLGIGQPSLFNSAERVAVAKSLGETSIPIAFLYTQPETPPRISECSRLVAGADEDQHPVSIATILGAADGSGGKRRWSSCATTASSASSRLLHHRRRRRLHRRLHHRRHHRRLHLHRRAALRFRPLKCANH